MHNGGSRFIAFGGNSDVAHKDKGQRGKTLPTKDWRSQRTGKESKRWSNSSVKRKKDFDAMWADG